MGDADWVTLSREAKLNISWFLKYAELGNGISLLIQAQQPYEIECDACLHGGGGVSTTSYYKWRFSPHIMATYKTIHKLEAINLLVAFKTLAPNSKEDEVHVMIHTDNMASSFALMTGKTKDRTLGACARQMWLEAANRHIVFTIKHKPGTEIPLADALSRYHTDKEKASLADLLIRKKGLLEKPPIDNNGNFFDLSL